MAYRKFDTGAWQDPWFEDLDTKAKLAFIYLWTNDVCNPSGMYEISDKRINFELGYGMDTVSDQLNPKVVWYPELKMVWIKNFFRHQCQNYKFALAALSSIKNDAFKLSLFIEHNRNVLESFKDKDGKQIIDLSIYHIDTISSCQDTVSCNTNTVILNNDTISPKNDTISHGKPTVSPTISCENDTVSSGQDMVDLQQNRTEQIQNRNNNPQPCVKKPDTKDSASSFPPSGISFKNLKSKKVTPNPMSKNNGKRLDEYFQGINQACDKIATLPPKQKKFDPFKWAQQQIGKSQHPGAIMESLDGLIMFWDSAHDPWSYASNILSKKNGNFNEQEAIACHEELKNMKTSQLEFLTQGLLREMPS